MQQLLDQTYLGNTVLMYVTAAGIFILSVATILVLKRVVLKRFKKWAESTNTNVDDFIIRGIEKTIIPLLYFGGFYVGLITLNLDYRIARALGFIATILVTYFVIKLIISVIRYSLNAYMTRKGEPDTKRRQIGGILTIVSVIIWGLGLVFMLDNMGFEVTAVIAGLGIGGIAIALAAQTILGDLFSYFVIFFDRPFEIGDFITVNDKLGSVEYIGIKTTRIRSIGGEQVIFSNTDLVNSRVHNYKRMERRRIVFSLGVIYQTTYEQLTEIPGIIKRIIEEQKDTTFDRVHFLKYGDFSLNYEIVYYVNSPDYLVYTEKHHAINLAIFKEFSEKGIEFAYPTQTLFMTKDAEDNQPKSTLV